MWRVFRNLDPSALDLIDLVCSRREREALCQLPPQRQAERLLATWTLKEALAKALALGLSLAFNRVTVLWDDCGQPAVEREDGGFSEGWVQPYLVTTRLTRWHIASVAMMSVVDGAPSIRFDPTDLVRDRSCA